MLEVGKNITFTGHSIIDGRVAESYQAIISDVNPKDINMSSWQVDRQLYKKNREQCRADSAEFEDMAYSVQDEMIVALGEEAPTEGDEESFVEGNEEVPAEEEPVTPVEEETTEEV